MSTMDTSTANLSEPLKRAPLHILLALADDDSYGYAIMQAVREQSGGRVPLRTGSLYRHLSKLIDQGLVAKVPPPDAVEDPRRGAHYRLTPRGRRALEREREHLAGVVAALEQMQPASGRGSR